MGPYQQYQAPQNQGSPYEFMFEPQKPPRRKLLNIGGNNFVLTIGVLVGGAILLMLIIVLILNIVTGGGGNTSDLISLTETQHEFARVTGNADQTATSQTTKNLAITIDLTMNTQEEGTLALLKKQGVNVSTKELSLKQNASTDQQLANAEATSTYDQVFDQLMQQQLSSYAGALKQLYNKTRSASVRSLTSNYYSQTEKILSQIPLAEAQQGS